MINDSPANPSVVLDLLVAFRRSKAMFAAVGLGVFDALELGPKTAAVLAGELKADADALARLLDALRRHGVVVAANARCIRQYPGSVRVSVPA